MCTGDIRGWFRQKRGNQGREGKDSMNIGIVVFLAAFAMIFPYRYAHCVRYAFCRRHIYAGYRREYRG